MTRKTLAAISRLNKEQKGARRVNNIVARLRGLDTDGQRFSLSAESLIKWTEAKTEQMRDRKGFPDTVKGLRRLFKELGIYLGKEKPPKCSEKVGGFIYHFGHVHSNTSSVVVYCRYITDMRQIRYFSFNYRENKLWMPFWYVNIVLTCMHFLG